MFFHPLGPFTKPSFRTITALRPSSSALVGNTLWTVQSQLDHIIDDENGALGTPPDLPFQIVGVPLDDLVATSSSSSPISPPTPATVPTASPSTSTSSAENMFDRTPNRMHMVAVITLSVVIATIGTL
jgi:hypothetical protein